MLDILVPFKNVDSMDRELQGREIFIGKRESLSEGGKCTAKYEIINRVISMLNHAEGGNRGYLTKHVRARPGCSVES